MAGPSGDPKTQGHRRRGEGENQFGYEGPIGERMMLRIILEGVFAEMAREFPGNSYWRVRKGTREVEIDTHASRMLDIMEEFKRGDLTERERYKSRLARVLEDMDRDYPHRCWFASDDKLEDLVELRMQDLAEEREEEKRRAEEESLQSAHQEDSSQDSDTSDVQDGASQDGSSSTDSGIRNMVLTKMTSSSSNSVIEISSDSDKSAQDSNGDGIEITTSDEVTGGVEVAAMVPEEIRDGNWYQWKLGKWWRLRAGLASKEVDKASAELMEIHNKISDGRWYQYQEGKWWTMTGCCCDHCRMVRRERGKKGSEQRVRCPTCTCENE